jgi:hypothetical protein
VRRSSGAMDLARTDANKAAEPCRTPKRWRVDASPPRFTVPMRARKGVGALHEPPWERRHLCRRVRPLFSPQIQSYRRLAAPQSAVALNLWGNPPVCAPIRGIHPCEHEMGSWSPKRAKNGVGALHEPSRAKRKAESGRRKPSPACADEAASARRRPGLRATLSRLRGRSNAVPGCGSELKAQRAGNPLAQASGLGHREEKSLRPVGPR